MAFFRANNRLQLRLVTRKASATAAPPSGWPTLTGRFNAEDERSWQVSYALTSPSSGVPGLTYRVAPVRGDNIKTRDQQRQVSARSLQPGPVRGAGGPAKRPPASGSLFLRFQRRPLYNDDGNEIRAFVEYPFSVF